MRSTDTRQAEVPAVEPVATPAKPARRRRRRGGSSDGSVYAGRLAVFAVLMGIWWLAANGLVNPLFIAGPWGTFTQLLGLLGESAFWADVLVTLREVAIGWAVGSVLGLLVGMALGRYDYASRVFGPYLTFFNSTPKIAYAPLIILWFGIGEPSKIVLAIVMAFFIVRLPTQSAVELLDPDLDMVATTMGATEVQKFTRVVLPGILAAVFGALRLAAVYSLLAVVMAEILASYHGLGQRLIHATGVYDMETAFATIIVLAFIAMGLNGLVKMLETRFMRWRASTRNNETISL